MPEQSAPDPAPFAETASLPASPGVRVTRAPPWLRVPLAILATGRYLGTLASALYRAAMSPLWEVGRGRRLARSITLRQVYFTAAQALPLTLFVALAIGVLLMQQGSDLLGQWGFPDYAESLTILLLKEIAPLTVALILIARSATAIVIELGNMEVNGEVRALEAMGINIDRYIVLPRVVGMVLSVTLLTGVFCATCVYGGHFVARVFGAVPSDFVLAELMRNFTPSVLFNILVRAFCFGFVIAAVACVHGLRVRFSAAEVPKEASRCVVRALSICVAINFLIATFLDLEIGR